VFAIGNGMMIENAIKVWKAKGGFYLRVTRLDCGFQLRMTDILRTLASTVANWKHKWKLKLMQGKA